MTSSETNVLIPEPHYSLLDTSRDGMPAVVVVNDALFSFDRKEVFAWQLEISIDAIEMAEHGMPTHREAKLLDELGEAIESALTRATTDHGSVNVLFLARVTCDSRRELTYRVHDPELANEVLTKAVADHQTREWSFEIVGDERWEAAQVFEDLYKSAFD